MNVRWLNFLFFLLFTLQQIQAQEDVPGIEIMDDNPVTFEIHELPTNIDPAIDMSQCPFQDEKSDKGVGYWAVRGNAAALLVTTKENKLDKQGIEIPLKVMQSLWGRFSSCSKLMTPQGKFSFTANMFLCTLSPTYTISSLAAPNGLTKAATDSLMSCTAFGLNIFLTGSSLAPTGPLAIFGMAVVLFVDGYSCISSLRTLAGEFRKQEKELARMQEEIENKSGGNSNTSSNYNPYRDCSDGYILVKTPEKSRHSDTSETSRQPDTSETSRQPDTSETSRHSDTSETSRHSDTSETSRHSDTSETSRHSDDNCHFKFKLRARSCIQDGETNTEVCREITVSGDIEIECEKE
jgi:hypothetical protein